MGDLEMNGGAMGGEEDSGPSDAELIAIANEAMGDSNATLEAQDSVLEGLGMKDGEEPAEKPAPAAAKPAAAEVDPKEVIRRRMEKARMAKQAKAEQRRQLEMRERLRQYEDEAPARQAQTPSFDVDSFKSKLRTSPLTALQELGVDLNEFTQAALEENTPQAKLMAQMKSMQDRIEAFEKERKEFEEKRQAETKQREKLRQQQEFCSIITPEEYPSLHSWFSDDVPALVREAETVAAEFLQRGGDPDDLSDDDIAWYLEKKYSKRLERVKGKAAAAQVATPAVKMSKPRGLSQAAASQTTHGTSKDFWNMSDDEQTALLVEIARTEMTRNASS